MKKLRYYLLLASIVAPSQVFAQSNGIAKHTNFDGIDEVPTQIYKALILFMPGVAVVYLIFSGYRYIVAQGNPDLVEKAKKSLTYAVYGVIIAFAASLIITIVANWMGIDTGFSNVKQNVQQVQ